MKARNDVAGGAERRCQLKLGHANGCLSLTAVKARYKRDKEYRQKRKEKFPPKDKYNNVLNG
jgi:hypothetical protein